LKFHHPILFCFFLCTQVFFFFLIHNRLNSLNKYSSYVCICTILHIYVRKCFCQFCSNYLHRVMAIHVYAAVLMDPARLTFFIFSNFRPPRTARLTLSERARNLVVVSHGYRLWPPNTVIAKR
jgi:hypothetical protein